MKIQVQYFIRIIFRIIIAATTVVIYCCKPEMLDFTAWPLSPYLYVLWGILFVDLITRFIPGKHHPFGMQKHLKVNFAPTKAYTNLQCSSSEGLRQKLALCASEGNIQNRDAERIKAELHKQRKGAIRVFVVFGLLNTLFYSLFFTGIFRPKEMLLVLMLYYVGDLICSNLFCPFRELFMKNRCCTVCRIYSWDSTMLMSAVMFVFSPFSLSLSLIAVIHTALWEIQAHRHPEYFMELTNENLSCANCKRALCPTKRKVFFSNLFKGSKKQTHCIKETEVPNGCKRG